MNLSPRQLRIFVALAESLSFSRTAERFSVAQPTLSKLVRELEEDVGVRLFERSTRSVKLTADGEALVDVARRVMHEFDGGLTELEQVARRGAQRLSIAALPTLAAMLLPQPLAALQAELPNALVRIYDVFTDEALDLLRARKVDLALTGVDVVHKDLAYTEILREPFVLLSSREHHAHLRLRRWDEEAIAALPVITMPRGTGTRQYLESAFLRQGLPFRPFLELNQVTSVARFVKAGCGVSLLPLAAARLVQDEDLVATPLAGAPERSIGIVTRREMQLPRLAARMVRAIRQHAAGLGVMAPLAATPRAPARAGGRPASRKAAR